MWLREKEWWGEGGKMQPRDEEIFRMDAYTKSLIK